PVRRDVRELADQVHRAARPPLVVQAGDGAALRSHIGGIAMRVEVAAEDRQLLRVFEIVKRAAVGQIAHLRRGDRCEPSLHARAPVCLKSTPVISAGCSRPSIARSVGPTSQRAPPERSGESPAPTVMKGTGLVVCAVCGPPVSGSIISSQFPWSAVMRSRAPARSPDFSTRARQASTVSTALIVAGIEPVWPSMSPFA